MARRRNQGSGSITQLPNGKWRGSFEVGYTASGNRRRISVTASTKRGCEKRLHDRMQEVRLHGVNTTTARISDLKQWLDIWLEERARTVRPKTFQAEAGPLRKYVIPTIGKTKLSALSPDHVRSVRGAMEEAGCSPTTIRYTQRILQQALKAAVNDGKEVPQAVLLMPKPKSGLSDRGAIPIDDAKRLSTLAWETRATMTDSIGNGGRWVAALMQGMRQGECLGLTWDNVNFVRNEIVIRHQLSELPYLDREQGTFQMPPDYDAKQLTGRFHLTPVKSKSGYRVIPMVKPMREALLEWREQCPDSPYGLVWPRSNGCPQNKKNDLAQWKNLQRQTGVHKGTRNGEWTFFVLHEARNTAATLLLAAKVDPLIITQILGHASIVTSQGYMSVSQEQKLDALTSVAKELDLFHD